MKDEYAKAGVPMLPVVRGEHETRRQILLYTVLLYAVTQLPFCAGGFGVEYLIASMTLGAGFIYCAVRLLRSADRALGAAHLPLLARLPGAALRLDAARPARSSRNRPWIARAQDEHVRRPRGRRHRRRRSSPSASSSPSSTSPHEPSTATSPSPASSIYPPRPSWAPALFAFALALAVCGIFAEGFMVRGWIYSIIGVVVALFALRSMTRDAVRELLQAPAQAADPRRGASSRQISVRASPRRARSLPAARRLLGHSGASCRR